MTIKISNFINKLKITLSADISIDWDYTTLGELVFIGLMFHLVCSLASNTDIINQFVSLLRETSLETAVDQVKSMDIVSLGLNNVTTSKLDSPINIQLNANSIQLIIFHAKNQLIYLATLNVDHSLNIQEQAIVNGDTSREELNEIYDRFMHSFNTIISTRTQPISIQTTIITKTDPQFWFKSEPFIPILDLLVEHSFNLSAYMYDIPTINLHLQNVGLNIMALELFENELIHRNGILNNLLTLAENANLPRQPA